MKRMGSARARALRSWILCVALPTMLVAHTPAESPRAPVPEMVAVAISEPIEIDGFLDEPAWQAAPVGGGFLQRNPDTGQAATEATEVRVLYDEEKIYFAIRCLDSEPDKIVAREMREDGPLFNDDFIYVMLDTFHDHRNMFFFETNPNGARTDAMVTDEGRIFNLQWDSVWEVKTQITEEGWQVEIAVPLTSIRFDPALDTWGFQVSRAIRRKNEDTFWSPLPLGTNPLKISLGGHLTGLRGLTPGYNITFTPFLVGSSVDTRLGVPRTFEEEDVELGGDFKWMMSRQLALDLTYNTDFAEAELDDLRVNLTRFSLFLPEKRDFFLENAGVFDFGTRTRGGTPLLKSFFSRRIGVGPRSEQIPIEWGARLTGRTGDWNIGILNVETEPLLQSSGFASDVPRNNWSVVRLKRDVGTRSTFGVIATNREGEGDDFNRVYGLDADFNFSRLNINTFITQSEDSDLPEDDDWAAGIDASWEGAYWDWSFDTQRVGENYNPEMGFLLRQGVRRYAPRVAWQPRPKDHPFVRHWHFQIQGEVFTTDDDTVESIDTQLDFLGLRTKWEDEYYLFATRSFDRLFVPFPIFSGVVIPEGEYHWNSYGARYVTNSSRLFSSSGSVAIGDFYDGERVETNLSTLWRPSRYFRWEMAWNRNDVDLPAGSFVANIYRQRLNVALSTNLNLNTLLQYSDSTDLLSLNVRLNWIYRPGSDIYLVFNQTWNAPTLGARARAERQAILKYTYLIDF